MYKARPKHRFRGWGALLLCLLAGVLAELHGQMHLAYLAPSEPRHFSPPRQLPPVKMAAPPRRTVLVIIDGLREDFFWRQPELAALTTVGAYRRSFVGLPSYSRPVYASISTGMEPSESGVMLNLSSAPLLADSIFDRARAAGIRTYLRSSAYPWWNELFPGRIDSLGPTGFFVEEFVGHQEEEPSFWVIHLIDVDDVGHRDGASAPSYERAAASVARDVGRLADLLDLSRDLLIVTSDHGHLDQGGHGGPEREVVYAPLLFLGKGVRPGRYPLAEHVDIAPTLAVHLGVPPPFHAQGRILLDQLDLPTERLRPSLKVSIDLLGERWGGLALHPLLEEAHQALARGDLSTADELITQFVISQSAQKQLPLGRVLLRIFFWSLCWLALGARVWRYRKDPWELRTAPFLMVGGFYGVLSLDGPLSYSACWDPVPFAVYLILIGVGAGVAASFLGIRGLRGENLIDRRLFLARACLRALHLALLPWCLSTAWGGLLPGEIPGAPGATFLIFIADAYLVGLAVMALAFYGAEYLWQRRRRR